MKKLVFLSLLAAVLAAPAFAGNHEKKEVELKDGTKAVVEGDAVTVAGKPAPDGEHELKDGTKITTKGGKLVK